MTPSSARERAIFEACLERPPAARRAFIAEHCAGDEKLEERVLRLVAADARGRQLDGGIVRRPTEADTKIDGCSPYRAIKKLGEGGMGLVYLAEQTRPVRRRVALKIIKRGMRSKEAIARFESERQALALLDHRNIARILDAVTCSNGNPAYAMEYVPGEPIVAYARRKQLSLQDRLRLFVEVCSAMQHAHQKGIIHRDLKPSNILVMEEDGLAIPKIIDFGIAKAPSIRLTDHTLTTASGGILGTPNYMSPEQANPYVVDVDTRADIYSLGVILYELVAGVVPFDFSEMKHVQDMHRVIQEEEAPAPSTRLTGAARRAAKNELDWVVMKALAKDRAERYPTAQAFAEDVTRLLNDEPVRAGHPGIGSRMRKFVKRHRTLIAVASVVFAALVTGLAVASIGLVEARHERDAARAARDQSETVTAFLEHMLSAPSPRELGRDVSVRTLMDEAATDVAVRFKDQPLVAARLYETIGSTYSSLGLYARAELSLTRSARLLENEFQDTHPDRLDVDLHIARVYRQLGRLREGERLALSVLERSRRAHGEEHPHTIDAINELALAYTEQGRDEAALELQEMELKAKRRVYGENNFKTLQAMHNVALQFARHGRYAEAESIRLRLVELARKNLGHRHPLTILTLRGLAALYKNQDRFAEANHFYREALFLSREVMGADHPDALGIAMSFGELLEREGNLSAAEDLLRETQGAFVHLLGPSHPETLRATNDLGRVLMKRGEAGAAGELLAASVRTGSQILDADSAFLARYRVDYATYLMRAGDWMEAERELLESRRSFDAQPSLDNLSRESLRAASEMLASIQAHSRSTSTR